MTFTFVIRNQLVEYHIRTFRGFLSAQYKFYGDIKSTIHLPVFRIGSEGMAEGTTMYVSKATYDELMHYNRPLDVQIRLRKVYMEYYVEILTYNIFVDMHNDRVRLGAVDIKTAIRNYPKRKPYTFEEWIAGNYLQTLNLPKP